MAAKTRTAKPRSEPVDEAAPPPDKSTAAQPAEARRRDRAARDARAAVDAAHQAAERAVVAAIAGMQSSGG